MLDENQYEEFRFVGMGEKAAVKQFKEDAAKAADREAELAKWQKEYDLQLAKADKTEKSVYDLAFADQMLRLWKNELEKNG